MSNIMERIEKKEEELWKVKASYLADKQEVYFKRTINNIFENPDIVELSKTEVGAISILNCISLALQMGLQIGGHIPQAYIVPMPVKDKETGNWGKKAVLIPSLTGYKFIALSDPPVLKDFFISAAYEKDEISVDVPNGEVKHQLHIGADRGKLIGVYAIMTNLDGIRRADWMSRKEIENVRDNHSPTYKKFKKKKLDSCTWETDFDMQAIKTAGKRFLKPFASLKEGLYMALQCEDEKPEYVVPEGDITDRVGDNLDKIIDADIIPEEKTEESKPATQEKPKEKPEENQDEEFKPIF